MDCAKYAASHASPNGPGDDRPTALKIVRDEDLEGKFTDKVIFITGCSSGIGIETARALAATGATLYLTARDLSKARSALGHLVDEKQVHLLELDLNSLASVRKCAADFLSKSSTLNILINNAGVMIPPEGRTVDGFETQFGTNHLAHFLLIQLLKDTLLESATPKLCSRVIMVSSTGHRASEVQFDNYNFQGCYDPWKAYGQSKTAMIWTANEIDRRFGSSGLHAFSLHPGNIVSGLQKYASEDVKKQWSSIPGLEASWKAPEQGAATTVWAAIAGCLEGKGGLFLEDCQIIGPLSSESGLLEPGYAPWVYDKAKAEKLYDLSLSLVGLS
jgi:NAD(P)-dependent dehydrogenase (short-subunit alcohol dehydrogenase family)